MLKFLCGVAVVACLGFGIYYHDFRIDRRIEIAFFVGAAASFLLFEWLLHRR